MEASLPNINVLYRDTR